MLFGYVPSTTPIPPSASLMVAPPPAALEAFVTAANAPENGYVATVRKPALGSPTFAPGGR